MIKENESIEIKIKRLTLAEVGAWHKVDVKSVSNDFRYSKCHYYYVSIDTSYSFKIFDDELNDLKRFIKRGCQIYKQY